MTVVIVLAVGTVLVAWTAPWMLQCMLHRGVPGLGGLGHDQWGVERPVELHSDVRVEPVGAGVGTVNS